MEVDKVRCNDCMTVFNEDKIIIIDEEEYCPNCNKSGCLMDLEKEEEKQWLIIK